MSFLAVIRKLLAPPVLLDEDETRIASTLHWIGVAQIPLALVINVAIWFSERARLPRVLLASAFIGFMLLSMGLARSSRVRAGARLFVIGSWLVIAIALGVSRGYSSAATSALVLTITASGLLLRPRSTYVIAALSSLLAPVFAILDRQTAGGAGAGQALPIGMWLTQASIFVGTAALVSIAARQADQSRARARQNEARFRAIAEHVPDIVMELDEEGRIIYGNASALAGSGRAPLDALLGERLDVFMHPDDAPEVMEKIRSIALRGGSDRAVFRTVGSRGRPGALDATAAAYVDAGGRRRVVTVARDVTSQRKTEAALRESEMRYRLLAENAPDMIFEFGASGRIDYVNPRALAELGYEFDEFRSIPPGHRVHPDDSEMCLRALADLAEQGGPSRLVHRLARKDGTYVWVASSGARYVSAIGEVHLVVQSRDLTAELSLQEQLRQSQKMDAIGRLAGGVAHDFNNLLTVIGGYASVLEGSLAPGAEASAAHEISDATARAASLTRQLLLLSRRQLAQPGAVDLNGAIRGIEPILRRTLPERIRLDLVLDPELPAIEIDPSHVDQVMLNLALNARDAMPDPGTIRIETRSGRGGRSVHLSVSDTGHGMDEATRARAFEPFFTTKPAGAGTGLGLSTIYGIVRQSGGSISLESAVGRGTRVEISLPASASRPGVASRPAVSIPVRADREMAILLVEDDASVRRLIGILLESSGYRVTSAGDASEALALVSGSQRKFDLLVTDYVMPGQSGVELCRQLRERWPDLGIVLMSGYAEIEDSEVAGLPRGAELLGKPFTRQQLQRAVTRLTERA